MKFLHKKDTPVPPRRRRQSAEGKGGDDRSTVPTSTSIYRRNRTLTGSLVSHISSAGEQKAELRSPRMYAHDLRRTRRHMMMALVGIIFMMAGCGFLLMNITATPLVTGNFNDNHRLYQQGITAYLTDHPLERLRFTLDTTRLTTYLQTHGYTEVARVMPETQQTGLGRTTYTLAMRQAAVVWTINKRQRFVDTDGMTFTRSYTKRQLVEVIDESGIDTHRNQVLVSDQFLGFIGKIVGAMHQYDLTVQKITLPAGTTRQIYVWITGVEYPIKVSVDRSAYLQSEDASRVIRYMAAHRIVPEYVDVRVGGRAAYRQK